MKDIQNMKSVTWDLTGNCNLRCKHCYNADAYFDSKTNKCITHDLDLNTCLETVKQLHQHNIEHIHFLGGEPLLAQTLEDVIKEAKKYDMYISINSNAVLLDENMQNKLDCQQFPRQLF